MKGILLGAAAVFLSVQAHATFIPKSQMAPRKYWTQGPSNVTQEQFNNMIKDLQSKYAPIVRALGGTLQIQGDWSDDQANAGSQQMFGQWIVKMYGGLARRPEMTADGMTLVVCHELGHHLGGFPFVGGGDIFGGGPWAANEGEADYYATFVCAHKVWGGSPENASFRQTASDEIKQNCNRRYSNTDDQDICYRTLVASQSLGDTLAGLSKSVMPRFSTPDTSAVGSTNNDHPAAQCRLDTYMQAALCTAHWNDSLVPGKTVSGGVDSIDAEQESSSVSCYQSKGFNEGLRPTCWFHPRL
jgi:hypothetical protein